MKSYLPCIFFFFVVSCLSKEPKVEKMTIPVIVDTFGLKIDTIYDSPKYPDYLSRANFPPLYIGIYKDSIYICNSIGVIPPPPLEGATFKYKKVCGDDYNDFYKEYWTEDDFLTVKDIESAHLIVHVDTSQLFNDLYPTIIKNIDTLTTIVGELNSVYLLMEALDRDDMWKPIQRVNDYLNEHGSPAFLLPPDNIIFTVTPKFKGSYFTKLRLKLGKNYSNEFDGWIDPNQFKRKFD